MIKLVATDIDGTFMRSNYTYDAARFDKIFAKMTAADCNFVVASGNQYYQLRKIFSAHADKISYVSDNGAFVMDRGELVFAADIPKSAVAKVAEIFRRHEKISGFMCGVKSTYFERGAISEDKFNFMTNYLPKISWTDDLTKVDDQILKFAMLVPKEEYENCYNIVREEVGEILDVTSSGYETIDLIVRGCHKASGIKRLAERWGITPAECAAFGDSENDIEMLKFCGESYAMKNAAQEVKNFAKYICPSNDEDGVLLTLEKIFA